MSPLKVLPRTLAGFAEGQTHKWISKDFCLAKTRRPQRERISHESSRIATKEECC